MGRHSRSEFGVKSFQDERMARITVELLRKRSEHNEGEISTLEELALHQENIARIELLNQNCRNLKILLLQYNVISKIENVNKLKKLEYLNLALNNIEAIENLEGLESLQKLDLMVNFIGDVRGVECLRNNARLEQLILTGNPCCEYEGYRDYVVATLPQLRELDMRPIERSERIRALQNYAEAEGDVIRGFRRYSALRHSQRSKYYRENDLPPSDSRLTITEIGEDEEDEAFWNKKTGHSPEERIELAKRTMRAEARRERSRSQDFRGKPKAAPKLFSPEGRPYNVNQAKVAFRLSDGDDDDDPDNVRLEVSLYKHLDSAYVEADVQPRYVRVTIKGKVLQLALPCEVLTDRSLAQRNTTTGCLVITMPRLEPLGKSVGPRRRGKRAEEELSASSKTITMRAEPPTSKREWLEIGPPVDRLDFLRTVGCDRGSNDEDVDFEDDPEVPPLE